MKISAAIAAALAILTEALDGPDVDIAHSLNQLTVDVAAAIPSYLGLSVVVPQSNPSITVTTLVDGVPVDGIRTSLHAVLPGSRDDPAPVTVILYAGTPGSFVDLAADLAWLTGRPLSDFTLDAHLTIPAYTDTAAELQAATDINQAIGVLIGRGYTPQQAHWQLDTQAANNRTDRHVVARRILDRLTAADDDNHFDIH